MENFISKSKARIYTNTQENVEKIKSYIKQLDEFEYGYMPDDLVAVYNGNFDLVYNGKFEDIDIPQLQNMCFQKDIPCGIIFGYCDYDGYNIWYASETSIHNCIKNFYQTGFWNVKNVLSYYGLEYLKFD